jgi:hypothetical protein
MADEEVKKEEVVEVKKTDEQILFPEAKVTVTGATINEVITLKPWAFGQLLDVNPYLSDIFDELETQLEIRGITLDQATITFNLIKSLYFSVAAKIIPILVVTCRDDKYNATYFRELDIASITKLTYVVWQQNQDNIKNALTLFAPSTPPSV